MKRVCLAVAMTVSILTAGCFGGDPPTASSIQITAWADYNRAAVAALSYADLQRCGVGVVGTCSIESVVAENREAGGAARDAIALANLANAEGEINEDLTVKAQKSIKHFVRTLCRNGIEVPLTGGRTCATY